MVLRRSPGDHEKKVFVIFTSIAALELGNSKLGIILGI